MSVCVQKVRPNGDLGPPPISRPLPQPPILSLRLRDLDAGDPRPLSPPGKDRQEPGEEFQLLLTSPWAWVRGSREPCGGGVARGRGQVGQGRSSFLSILCTAPTSELWVASVLGASVGGVAQGLPSPLHCTPPVHRGRLTPGGRYHPGPQWGLQSKGWGCTPRGR